MFCSHWSKWSILFNPHDSWHEGDFLSEFSVVMYKNLRNLYLGSLNQDLYFPVPRKDSNASHIFLS